VGNLSSIVQILVFVLVIAGPVISAIARQIKVHAEQRRIEEQRKRQRAESLRTGRPLEPEVDPKIALERERRARMEELARQRQAQLEELRRRQREAAARAAQTRQTPVPVRQGGPARGSSVPAPVRVQTPPQARTPFQPEPSRGSKDAARKAELERRKAELRARKAEYERAAAAERAEALAAAEARPASAPAAPRGPAPARQGAALGGVGIASAVRDSRRLREAIILSEVLGPPVSLRPPQNFEA